MAVIQSVWILIAVSVFEVAQGFYPMRAPCLPQFPRQDSSCRDTIEDLKALLEITQALQPNQSYTCPSCSSTFSEEIILKLVNALIYTATQNCGTSNVGGGGSTGGILGSLLGGLIGGGINPGIGVGGGHTGSVGGGTNSGGVNTGMLLPNGNSRNGGSNGEGLIQLGVLDGQDTVHADLGGNKLLGVDLGQQSGSGKGRGVPISGGDTGKGYPSGSGGYGLTNDNGLIQLGVLDGQDTVHADLGGKKLLGVDLGQQSGSGKGRGVPISGGDTGKGYPSGSGGYGLTNDNGLIQLGVLDGQDTVHADLGGKKLLGVDLGQQSGSGKGKGVPISGGDTGMGYPSRRGGYSLTNDNGLINLGVLNGGSDLLDLGLGGKELLGVDLG